MASGRNRQARPAGPTTKRRAVPGGRTASRGGAAAPNGRSRLPSDGAPGGGARGGGDPKDAAMDQLKWEVAGELSLDDDVKNPDELSVREAGKIGGNMVKRLIEKGKGKLENER